MGLPRASCTLDQAVRRFHKPQTRHADGQKLFEGAYVQSHHGINFFIFFWYLGRFVTITTVIVLMLEKRSSYQSLSVRKSNSALVSVIKYTYQ